MRSMHEFTDETARLSDAIQAHTAPRIAPDPPPGPGSAPGEATERAGPVRVFRMVRMEESGEMRSMHEFTDETARLSDAIQAHTARRIAHDQPLDRASTPDELTERAGKTITPEGIGGEEALRIWA